MKPELIFILLILFSSCKKPLGPKEAKAYEETGKEVSKNTAAVLSETLTSKMKSGGIAEAVNFCNMNALPITKEMSEKHHVSIKRTSLKTRNTSNKPTDNEVAILEKYQKKLDKGNRAKPIVKRYSDGSVHYYAPIFIEKKCLICHGVLDQELSRVADSIIKSRYPNDLATGFKDGDLRGMWSISFP